MKIAIAGPVELHRFSTALEREIPPHYSFPLIGELAEELRRRGHHISIVTTSRHIDKRWQASAGGLDVVIVPDRRRPRDKIVDRFARERRSIQAELATFNADVINAHWLYEFGAAAMAMDGTICVVAHDKPLDVIRWNLHPYWASRVSLGFASHRRGVNIGAVAPVVAQQVKKVFQIRSAIELLPNWSSAASFASTRRDRGVNGLTIATVLNGTGRLKNPQTALKGFLEVRAKLPLTRMVMFGHGHDEHGALAGWARANSLSDGVEFRGPVEHSALLRFLSGEADLFLHPSRTEACSVAVLEAMCLNLPIVAGAHSGGIPWQLEFGRAGYLTNVGDAGEIAEAVLHVLLNAELSNILGKAAGRRAKEMFGMGVSIGRYEQWFVQCLRRRQQIA